MTTVLEYNKSVKPHSFVGRHGYFYTVTTLCKPVNWYKLTDLDR